jgi:hypothetical protein
MLDDAEVDHGLEDGLDEDDLQEVHSDEVSRMSVDFMMSYVINKLCYHLYVLKLTIVWFSKRSPLP